MTDCLTFVIIRLTSRHRLALDRRFADEVSWGAPLNPADVPNENSIRLPPPLMAVMHISSIQNNTKVRKVDKFLL